MPDEAAALLPLAAKRRDGAAHAVLDKAVGAQPRGGNGGGDGDA